MCPGPAIYDNVEDASHLSGSGKMDPPKAIYDQIEDAPLVPEYDDGPDAPVTNIDKEQAYRQGFLDEARRIVRDWANPMPPSKPDAKPVSVRELMARCRSDPFSEIDAAKAQREHLREDYAVYEAGDAGPKTRHLGYRQGHEVPAAEWRGRHHAMTFVLEPWQHLDTADVDVFNPALLRRWLDAVENWASAPIDTTIVTPPRVLNVMDDRSLEADASEPTASLCETHSQPAMKATTVNVHSEPTVNPFAIRVDAVRLSDVEPEPVRWLWPGRFALGKLSLIAGQPGLGKSFLTLDIAARVSRGDCWPCDESTRCDQGGVVLLSAEDDIEDTIVPRLIAAQADRSRIQAMRALYQPQPGIAPGAEKPVPFSLLEHVPQLEELIQRAEPCRLVVVDPVSAFLGKTDSHNNSEVRSALAPLASMAERNGVAVIAVTHLNKGQGSALDRVIGSIAFTAAARAAYVVTRDEDDPARRLMLAAKNNLATDLDGFAYRLEGEPTPHVEWEAQPVAMSADEAVGGRASRGPEPDARRDAEAWLMDYLASGPRPAKALYIAASEDGHTKDTIRRAKATLGVQATKTGYQGAWVWLLPGSGPVMTGSDGGGEGETSKGTEGGL